MKTPRQTGILIIAPTLLRDNWEAFRQLGCAEIAEAWCEEKKIPFENDVREQWTPPQEERHDGEIDWDRVDEAALALMYLTTRAGRTWKSFDWGISDRLHEKGYIFNPRSKAKSVPLSWWTIPLRSCVDNTVTTF